MKQKTHSRILFFINFSLVILIITLISLPLFLLKDNNVNNNQTSNKLIQINYNDTYYDIDQDTIELEIINCNNIEKNKYYYLIIEDFINEDLSNAKKTLENRYYVSKFIVMEFYFAKYNAFEGTFYFENVLQVIKYVLDNLSDILNNYVYRYDIIWITPNKFIITVTEYFVKANLDEYYNLSLIFTETNYYSKYVIIDNWNGYYLFDENYEYFHEINLFVYEKLTKLKRDTKKDLWNKTSIIVSNIPSGSSVENFINSVRIFEFLLNKNRDFYINKMKKNKAIINKNIQIISFIWILVNKLQYLLIDTINGEIYISFYFEFEEDNWIYSFEYNNKITYEIGNIELENNREDSITIEKIYHQNIGIIIFLIIMTLLLILIIGFLIFWYIKKQKNIKKNYYI